MFTLCYKNIYKIFIVYLGDEHKLYIPSLHTMLHYPRQFVTYTSIHVSFFFFFFITKYIYRLKYKVNTKCQKYVCFHFEIATERNVKRPPPFLSSLFFYGRFIRIYTLRIFPLKYFRAENA